MSGDAAAALDISDKAILAATRQVRGVNDSIQLKYTLPSGRVVSSEPFRADQGAKALIMWCDVIRGQHEADAANERDQVRQRMIEEKAQRAREASGLLVDSSGNALSVTPTPSYIPPPVAQSQNPASAGLVGTPDDFLRSQLAVSREAVERLEWQVQEAMQALVNARANLQKWEALASALVPQAAPAPTAPVQAPRKRGRPKKVVETLVETKNDDS